MLKESQRRATAETREDIPHVGGIEGRLKLKPPTMKSVVFDAHANVELPLPCFL
jgi:hypothetical protein